MPPIETLTVQNHPGAHESLNILPIPLPQWETVDAEIKVPSIENPELNESSLFTTWSGSVLNRACYAYCQEFLPC